MERGQVLSREQGDVFQIYASPSARMHLYIYAVDATGWIQQLHPVGAGKDQAVPAGETLFLPARNRFYGLDDVPGVQQIFVMSSPAARPDVESMLARFPLDRERPDSEVKTRSGESVYEHVEQAIVLARGLQGVSWGEARIPNRSGEAFGRQAPRFRLDSSGDAAAISTWFRVD